MRRANRLWPLVLPAFLTCVFRAWPVSGQTVGSEFRVNTYTTDKQQLPRVSTDSVGKFVVVWTSLAQDGSGFGAFAQRYGSAGEPLGGEFRVNTYTTSGQYALSVASDSSGNFVVVWQSGAFPSSDVIGQRYSSAGEPFGGEFRVNTFTTGPQVYPSAASDSGGNFVVVWLGYYGQDGSSGGVFGQRYGSSGAPLGTEFRVNTYTTNGQAFPSVTSDSGGDFVVVWHSYAQDGSSSGVFGQRYGSTGAPLGAEFRVNTYTTNDQRSPSAASDSAGNFVVVWQSYDQVGSAWGVFGQRYDGTGAPLGGEFRVNTYTTGSQFYPSYPSVASDSGGNFVVVWRTFSEDGSYDGVFGQRYTSAGGPLGSEFLVNAFTTGSQGFPSVASGSGGFVVVWQSPQDGSQYGVFGQQFFTASNQLLNASFSSSLSGWNPVGAASASPSPLDSAGSTTSGSALVTNSSPMLPASKRRPLLSGTGNGIENACLMIAQTSYSFSAKVRVPSGQPRTGTGSVTVSWFADAACTMFVGSSSAPGISPFDTWQTTASTGVAPPPTAIRAIVGLTVTKDQAGGSFDVYFDDAYFAIGSGSCPILTAVSVGTMGSTTVGRCSSGGTATVTDVGGGGNTHQWGFRTVSGGPVATITGQVGGSYLITGSDFPASGSYFLVCTTSPVCGTGVVSNEIQVMVTPDVTAPVVSAPGSVTVLQTFCQ